MEAEVTAKHVLVEILESHSVPAQISAEMLEVCQRTGEWGIYGLVLSWLFGRLTRGTTPGTTTTQGGRDTALSTQHWIPPQALLIEKNASPPRTPTNSDDLRKELSPLGWFHLQLISGENMTFWNKIVTSLNILNSIDGKFNWRKNCLIKTLVYNLHIFHEFDQILESEFQMSLLNAKTFI